VILPALQRLSLLLGVILYRNISMGKVYLIKVLEVVVLLMQYFLYYETKE